MSETKEIDLATLRARLEEARELAGKAAYEIAEISQIIVNHPKMRANIPDSGTKSFSKYGLKTVTGYTGKWNQEMLGSLYQMFVESGTADLFPFEIVSTFKANEEALREFVEQYPDWGPAFSDALTTKPKNPGIYLIPFAETKKGKK